MLSSPRNDADLLFRNIAGVSAAECPSVLVLPALCPARISVSSSLLAATMNQKSSLREDPQFVSMVLTGNNEELLTAFLDDPSVMGKWRRLGGLETLHSYGVPVSPLMRGTGFD